MGFGSFFKKISRGATHFFHKVDHGASNFFKKTVPHLAHKVGGGLEQAGGVINTGLRKVGNTLEKNSALLGGLGAGIATALGQPEIALAIEGAGMAGQQLGQNIRAVRGNVNNVVSQAKSNINRGVGNTQNLAGAVRRRTSKQLSGLDNRLNIARDAVRNYNSGQVGQLNQAQTLQ
jgi:hypothetical protein